MPTKPISPLTETAAAVPRVAAMTTVSRSRATSTPEAARLGLADPEHVEQPPVGQQDPGRDDHVRQDQRDVGPGGQGQAAQDPA